MDAPWEPGPLPPGLELRRLEHVLSVRPGPGGHGVDQRLELRWEGGGVLLLAEVKPRALARDVPRIRERLQKQLDRERRLATSAALRTVLPALATDAATPSTVAACLREGLAVLDRRGTVIVRAPGLLLHIEGKGPLPRELRPRGSLFRGTAGRVARVLLAHPWTPFSAQRLADVVTAGYATTFESLVRLERDGFVERRSPRGGFQLTDPVRLLRAWIEGSERTAVAVDGYYAPALRPRELARAEVARMESGVRGIWTLASALEPEQVVVSGLPHGLYLSGDVAPVAEALKLRPVTPHNFLVLRAEPAADTEAGGIYYEPAALGDRPAVSLPQLAVDCAGAGGRGPEQANALLERYAARAGSAA